MVAGKTLAFFCGGLAVTASIALLDAPKSGSRGQEPQKAEKKEEPKPARETAKPDVPKPVDPATPVDAPKPDADAPAKQDPKLQAPPLSYEEELAKARREIREMAAANKDVHPGPLKPIPDDPPPHEGAMTDLELRVYPPDLITIEVLEALPGRPLTGSRLIRPDGTVSLGFYGDLHVSGLTVPQIKEKLIIHLRTFLTDETLGLMAEVEEQQENPHGQPADAEKLPPSAIPLKPARRTPSADAPAVPKDDESPFDSPPAGLPGVPKDVSPFDRPKGREAKKDGADSTTSRLIGERRVRFATQKKPEPLRQPPLKNRSPLPGDPDFNSAKQSVAASGPRLICGLESLVPRVKADEPVSSPQPQPTETEQDSRTRVIVIPPRESDRVFVDVESYNSQCYYVLGQVATPGRLPWTSRETVLDALQYGGGIVGNGDEKRITLVRPARGGKPAKTYPIDLDAIQKRGDVTANLQIFPGDRLFVEQSASAAASIKLNSDAARMNTMINTSLMYSLLLRSFDRLGDGVDVKAPTDFSIKVGDQTIRLNLGDTPSKPDPERRKAALKAMREFWEQNAKAAGPEEKRLIDEMIKALDK